MSHLRRAKCELKSVRKDVAKIVFQELVKAYGGNLVEEQGGVIGVEWGTYAYMKIDPNTCEWLYDDYSMPVAFSEAKQRFMDVYVAKMMEGWLRAHGYNTNMMINVDRGQVVLGAIRY